MHSWATSMADARKIATNLRMRPKTNNPGAAKGRQHIEVHAVSLMLITSCPKDPTDLLKTAQSPTARALSLLPPAHIHEGAQSQHTAPKHKKHSNIHKQEKSQGAKKFKTCIR